MIRSLKFPIGWLTTVAFVIVGVATAEVLLGTFFIGIVLPAVLATQWVIRWILTGFGTRVSVRRVVMLLPALILAAHLFRTTNCFGGKQTAAVTIALAGNTPKGIRDLHVQEDAWTDYVVFAYFRCDPASLRRILERSPFIQKPGTTTLSFRRTPFPDLHDRPDLPDVIGFTRSDLPEGSCSVYTDAGFTFAFVYYAVD